MLIVNKKTEKRTKLHIKTCVVCNTQFGTYRNTGKVCSMNCRYKLNGITKSRSIYRECVTCHKDFLHKPSEDRRGSIHIFCSMKCRHPNKKLNLPVGQYFSYDGYIVMNRLPDGRKQIKIHRYTMEQFLGRRLLSSEIVHHINENKIDNRIENLMVLTRGEHNSIHHSKLSNKT